MKNVIKINSLFFISLILLFSCDPKIDNPVGTGKLGSLSTDGSPIVYVAVGNSLTAGYMDGAVYPDGQKYSYPNLLAQQLKITDFVQPEYQDPGTGTRMYFYGFNELGLPMIQKSPVNIASVLNLSYSKPYNNLGIPGSVAYDLIDSSDFALRSQQRSNPFYLSVLRSQTFGKSVLEQAINLKPTLMTLWIGNNDVLGYATSGGTISTTGMPDNPMPTPTAVIQQIIGGSLQKIFANLPNTKVLLFTIPDVLGVPFFHVIPWNGLVLKDQSQVDQLNAAYKQLGITFKLGANGFIAKSKTAPGGIKQLTAADYITFTIPQDSILKAGWGTLKPIPDEYVLDANEANIVTITIAEYNAVIKGFADSMPGVKIVDMNEVFKNLLSYGYSVPGSTTLNSSYISGEMFSLDGIHPTPRGYGAITNEIIKVINANFNADIPFVNLQNLPAIKVYVNN
ncbi:MAG: SGNH/GDSL hydrolase family protein [Candidatus Kapaibacteriota bacterium]